MSDSENENDDLAEDVEEALDDNLDHGVTYIPFDPTDIDLSALDEDVVARIEELVESLPDGVTLEDAVAYIAEAMALDEVTPIDANPDGTLSSAPVPRTAADWYSGATKRLISGKVRSRGGSKPDALVLHIAAGESTSLYSFFSNPVRGCSHFYVRKNGVIEQYLPISSKSGAELFGNHHAISVETQGGSYANRNQPWTTAQVKAMAKIAAWLNAKWGVPLKRMTTSKASATGVGYHRLGINGNFPSSGIYAGRTQRGTGELWSSAQGKTCPENFAQPVKARSRIAQVDTVIALAKGEDVDTGGGDSGDSRVTVDGWWGRATTRLAQEVMGTTIDGVVSSQSRAWKAANPALTGGWVWVAPSDSNGSRLIMAMQTRCNTKDKAGLVVDGRIGPATIKAFQTRLTALGEYSGPIDGTMVGPSTTVMALQRALNDGKF